MASQIFGKIIKQIAKAKMPANENADVNESADVSASVDANASTDTNASVDASATVNDENTVDEAISPVLEPKRQTEQVDDTSVKEPPAIYKKLLTYRKWCIDKKNIWQGLYNFGFWSLLILWISLTFVFYGKDLNETGLFAVKVLGLLWYVLPIILRILSYVGIAIFIFRVCLTLFLRIWNKEVKFWERKDKLIRMAIELALQVILAAYMYEQFHLLAVQVYNWKSILLADISGEIQYYIRYVINQWRVLK